MLNSMFNAFIFQLLRYTHFVTATFLICLPLLHGHNYTDFTYEGHAVIHATPSTDTQLQLLHDLHAQNTQIEFWTKPGKLAHDVDIRVPPQLLPTILRRFRREGIVHEVTVDDLQRKIETELQNIKAVKLSGFNSSTYNTYEEITDWLQQVAEQCGALCSLLDIGRSYEGRTLNVLRLGTPEPDKPVIWIDAGIHAREWIAPATAVNIIQQLLDNRESDPQIRYLLDHYVWYILPLANPDGYAYTWTHDRLWRKTRSEVPGSPCKGADPNRNWNFHWGGPGTSRNPCSENFIGTSPFSEPETRAMADTILSLRERMVLYLTLHSFGQYWLTPWGFTYDVPKDYAEMLAAGRRASRVMEGVHGTHYRVGAASRMLYLASGGSDDWVKGVVGVKYTYTIELRDTGRHGFILPSDLIDSTSREMVQAVQALALDLARKKLLR